MPCEKSAAGMAVDTAAAAALPAPPDHLQRRERAFQVVPVAFVVAGGAVPGRPDRMFVDAAVDVPGRPDRMVGMRLWMPLRHWEHGR